MIELQNGNALDHLIIQIHGFFSYSEQTDII